MSATLDIGEVAKKTGMPTSTLRYYDDIGLIKSVGRNGLRRLFDASVIQQLSLISLGRLSGLSLDEVRDMFNHKGQVIIDRELLVNKANDIDLKIKQLTAMKNGLLHAANCPASNHLDCPTFQKLLHVANRVIKTTRKA